jgi:hypothetical protein
MEHDTNANVNHLTQSSTFFTAIFKSLNLFMISSKKDIDKIGDESDVEGFFDCISFPLYDSIKYLNFLEFS